MLNIGQLVDPIIIDKKYKIVLDGNHRLKVLELIKVPNAVCHIVDYSNPNITVGGWYPVDKRITLELIKKKGFNMANFVLTELPKYSDYPVLIPLKDYCNSHGDTPNSITLGKDLVKKGFSKKVSNKNTIFIDPKFK